MLAARVGPNHGIPTRLPRPLMQGRLAFVSLSSERFADWDMIAAGSNGRHILGICTYRASVTTNAIREPAWIHRPEMLRSDVAMRS
jgi:hypothetical protein